MGKARSLNNPHRTWIAVPAGTPVTIHVDYAKSMTSGQDYFGELLLGPLTAPSALSVPVMIHRN